MRVKSLSGAAWDTSACCAASPAPLQATASVLATALQTAFWEAHFCPPHSPCLNLSWYYKKQLGKNISLLGELQDIIILLYQKYKF